MTAPTVGEKRRALWRGGWLLLGLLCGLCGVVRAQEKVPAAPPAVLDTFRFIAPDSVRLFHADSTGIDTLRGDTIAAPAADEGVDTVVVYTAKRIDFDMERRISLLTGDATVNYKEMELTAGQIEVNWDKQIMIARPIYDTLYVDSARTIVDSVVTVGLPHFVQGSDDFTGHEIAYNMKTKIGRVTEARTIYEDGRYYGALFRRIADDVIVARDGRFTTCDVDPPHFHFRARTLKILVGRRVIARPVIFYFGDVPVLAVPYGIFPQQHGRTSGILVPTFGESTGQGRFLQNLGYYWAISDYTDVRSTIDWYERFGVLGRGAFRYTKRYVLDGETSFDFNLSRTTGIPQRNYSIRTTHSHVLDRATNLRVSASYVSSEAYNNNLRGSQDYLRQSTASDLTLTRNWQNFPWSMSANLHYEQNIRQKTWVASVPQVQFTHRSGKLFPPPKAPRGIRGAAAPRENNPPWYRTFSWGYGVSYRNTVSRPLTFEQEGLRLPPMDLRGNVGNPQIIYGTDSTSIRQQDGIIHTSSLSATARFLKYFNFNPSISGSQVWSRRLLRYEPSGHILDREDETGFFTRTTFSMGGTVQTNLYGIARQPLGLAASFRHMMTPSVNFTYRPDFSKPEWNYYETVTLPDGRQYNYDRWANSIAGGTPKGLSERFGFNVQHLFQMKTEPEDTVASPQKRFELLSWTMGTGVDVRRDSLKWDDLGMSFRTGIPGQIVGPVQNLSFDISTSHSLYDRVGGNKVRRFFWDRPGAKWYAPVELQNASFNALVSLDAQTIGGLFGFGERSLSAEEDTVTAEVDTLAALEDSLRGMQNLPKSHVDMENRKEIARTIPPAHVPTDRGPSQFYRMPLSLSLSFRHTRNYIVPGQTSSIFTGASFALTPKWNIDLDYTFDLDTREATNASVSVSRDLHCWEASFSWSPMGFWPGYFLHIGLRSPQLQDLKIERQRGRGFGGVF